MKPKVTPFDPADYLDNEEVIAEYLSQVLQDGDASELLSAIGYIAKARGMTKIAEDTGLGRESLYKAFSGATRPSFDTVKRVLNSLGLDMCIKKAILDEQRVKSIPPIKTTRTKRGRQAKSISQLAAVQKSGRRQIKKNYPG